jgi:hypothetical protein
LPGSPAGDLPNKTAVEKMKLRIPFPAAHFFIFHAQIFKVLNFIQDAPIRFS